MTRYSFEFESHGIFAIAGRGLVFRGIVLSGQAMEGDRITILDSDGAVSGKIIAIEKDRRLMLRTVADSEIGILLADFSNQHLEQMLAPHHQPHDSPNQDAYQKMLGVSFPVRLAKIDP